jgi:RNA polymerase sigma-70 factor (ECF subfamily)
MPLDRPTLERAFSAWEGPLYNTLYRWVWDAAEAQDLAQEAFLRVWQMRDRVDPNTLKPLLFRVALNLAANRRRSRKLWGFLTLEALRGAPSAGASPDGSLDQAQRVRATRAAVDALPERLRQVITLCELGQMSHAEVAQTLGIPVGTVGSRRHAALARLRVSLSDLADPSEISDLSPEEPAP